MKSELVVLLLVGGFVHLGIVVGSLAVPRVLNWSQKLAPLDTFTKRLFWVYAMFTLLVNLCFGVISLMAANEMAAGGLLARLFCGMIAVYWLVRLLVQWFVFDARPMLQTSLMRVGYHGLTVAFIYLTAAYGLAATVPL